MEAACASDDATSARDVRGPMRLFIGRFGWSGWAGRSPRYRGRVPETAQTNQRYANSNSMSTTPLFAPKIDFTPQPVELHSTPSNLGSAQVTSAGCHLQRILLSFLFCCYCVLTARLNPNPSMLAGSSLDHGRAQAINQAKGNEPSKSCPRAEEHTS